MRCTTLLLNVIVLVLGIMVLRFERISNLSVVVLLFVIMQAINAKKSRRN